MLTMNWFRSPGHTVTVTRSGVPVWSKPVRNTSKTAGIARELKERLLIDVGNAHRDPVSIADLLDADRVGQVADGALRDVLGHQQAGGSLGGEVHRVEGRLQGPRDVVDVPPLVPADHLHVWRDAEPTADFDGRHLDLDPGDGLARTAVLPVDLGQVVGTLGAAKCLGVPGQRVNERVDVHPYEGALAWPSLHQPRDDKLPDCVPNRVPGGAVPLAQFNLGRQLDAAGRVPGLNFSAQIIGDLLVHRLLCHQLSPETQPS